MASVVFTKSAVQDELDLFASVARGGAGVLARYEEELQRLYRILGKDPLLHATRPALGSDVRVAVVSPYLVLYRYRPSLERVTILRVLHGRRNITPAFMKLR